MWRYLSTHFEWRKCLMLKFPIPIFRNRKRITILQARYYIMLYHYLMDFLSFSFSPLANTYAAPFSSTLEHSHHMLGDLGANMRIFLFRGAATEKIQQTFAHVKVISVKLRVRRRRENWPQMKFWTGLKTIFFKIINIKKRMYWR